jgi:hypothetical protein
MKKRYSVSIPWHCSVVVCVDAQTAEEAKAVALEKVYPSICHQCSDELELGDINLECEPDVCCLDSEEEE